VTRSLCLLIALLLATSGCAAPALRVTGIPVAKDATFDLLSPAALGQSVSLEQIVDARYGDRQFSFHCLLEVDPEQLVLVGMTPMNTRAFTLTLRDDELSLDMAHGAQLPAPPERILADLQLALWPEPRVRGLEQLGTLGYGGPAGGSMGREFQRNGLPVIRVSYDEHADVFGHRWGKYLVFQHLEQNYELHVRTVRAEKLES